MSCESCHGILSGENDDECKNPECEMYVPSDSPPAMKGPRCNCGGPEYGTDHSPDCSWIQWHDDKRDSERIRNEE